MSAYLKEAYDVLADEEKGWRLRAARLEEALRDVLAEYEYQMGPFDAGHEPEVIRNARDALGPTRMTEPTSEDVPIVQCPKCTWEFLLLKPEAATDGSSSRTLAR